MTVEIPGAPVLRSAASRFAYEMFVVHADAAADEAFVNGYLLAKLGLAPERVLRLQTLELGESITGEIERGVRSSRVTTVVLSSAYMDDRWAAFGEQLAAYASVAKDVHGVLLPLLLDDCKLTIYVRALVKLDFQDPTRAAWEAEMGSLRAYLDRPAGREPDLPCLYPGMRPFTERDAGRFPPGVARGPNPPTVPPWRSSGRFDEELMPPVTTDLGQDRPRTGIPPAHNELRTGIPPTGKFYSSRYGVPMICTDPYVAIAPWAQILTQWSSTGVTSKVPVTYGAPARSDTLDTYGAPPGPDTLQV